MASSKTEQATSKWGRELEEKVTMKEVKRAKEVPTLDRNGANFLQWKTALLGSYRTQLPVVEVAIFDLNLAKQADPTQKKTLYACVWPTLCFEIQQSLLHSHSIGSDGVKLFKRITETYGKIGEKGLFQKLVNLRQEGTPILDHAQAFSDIVEAIGPNSEPKLTSSFLLDLLRKSLDTPYKAFVTALDSYRKAMAILIDIGHEEYQTQLSKSQTTFATQLGKKRIRCYNCEREGHMVRDCPETVKCKKCAGTHLTKNCRNQESKN